MNRTALTVIVLAVIVAIAGFMFYDGTADEGATVLDKADQTTTAPAAPAQ